MYRWLPTLQWCWAHLKRDYQALVDSVVRVAKELGKQLLKQARLLFRQWSSHCDETVSPAGLNSLLGIVRRKFEALLMSGLMFRHTRTSDVCRELCWYRAPLSTFLDRSRVEPTNNASERTSPYPLIWWKLSFDTQTAAGSRFDETPLSIVEACCKPGHDVFAFVIQAVKSQLSHHTAPHCSSGYERFRRHVPSKENNRIGTDSAFRMMIPLSS